MPNRPLLRMLLLAVLLITAGCSSAISDAGSQSAPAEVGAVPVATSMPFATTLPAATELPAATALPEATAAPAAGLSEALVADVTAVRVTGDAGAYQFAVEISSPDTGCEQFADWWEVITEDGELLYRRILLHSHVTEQPFTRSGGPVDADQETVLIVRAHMSNGGYGGQAYRGTVNDGFEAVALGPEFAQDLEQVAPLPEGCAF